MDGWKPVSGEDELMCTSVEGLWRASNGWRITIETIRSQPCDAGASISCEMRKWAVEQRSPPSLVYFSLKEYCQQDLSRKLFSLSERPSVDQAACSERTEKPPDFCFTTQLMGWNGNGVSTNFFQPPPCLWIRPASTSTSLSPLNRITFPLFHPVVSGADRWSPPPLNQWEVSHKLELFCPFLQPAGSFWRSWILLRYRSYNKKPK